MAVTDYVKIRGLQSSGSEVFQGIGGGSASTNPDDGGSGLEWGDMPEDALNLLAQYTDDINTWIQAVREFDPTTAAATGAVVPVAPAVPALLSVLATGGASLPAVATMFVGQTILNVVGSAIENYAKTFDPNSLEAIMRKSLIFQENGEDKSVLNERLSDLAYVDTIIDFGPFRAHIKGKMIEYA